MSQKKLVEAVQVLADTGPSHPLFYIYSKRHDSIYWDKSEPFFTRTEAEMVASERFAAAKSHPEGRL